ncbi:MAG: inorganic phosphate transporter [Bacteroidales bacterium]|jgi:phosphate/sulfate permease|nr:inorganic phosphate transporter [Bacteroidales bacterium]
MPTETFYILLVGFLFCLAIFDLTVGVSNDAVNFLNSAIGSKSGNIILLFAVASLGVFVGAAFSNGMMEIARNGIFQPQHFFFRELIFIFIAAMLTDVILLDLFNTLGLPTSTTVSLVFELLGATFAMATIKIFNNSDYSYAVLLNTDKALQVILGIFLSVAFAFIFGTFIQYVVRLIFTFDYKKTLKYLAGPFGGIAITIIVYFMLIKGLRDAAFMTAELKNEILSYSGEIVIYCFCFFTVIMYLLHWLKVNILKVIVLFGTFSLALAFAGNDLVNFIGLPLAGLSAFQKYMAAGGGNIDIPMTALASLKNGGELYTAPWYFLMGAGAIMVMALITSKKARRVIKTEVSLSRQGEGEEMFSSSALARNVVRGSRRMSTYIVNNTPNAVSRWINKRFSREGIKLEDGAAFDQLRAAVNLVTASSLIALGTSMKLPLSTTYVTFMVAMSTSLADRAWGRESAVYRVSGVINVIGGWFITAIAAFIITAIVLTVIWFGKEPALIIIIVIAAIILIRNHIVFRKRNSKKEDSSQTMDDIMANDDTNEALVLLRKYCKENSVDTLNYLTERYQQVVNAFCNEDVKVLRNLAAKIDSHKDDVKKIKRMGTLGIRKLSETDAFERGLYFHQANDFIGELVYDLARMSVACEEHIDNNFNPLDDEQKAEIRETSKNVTSFLKEAVHIIETGNYEARKDLYINNKDLVNQFAEMKRRQLKRIQINKASTKVSMVYISIVQETHNIVSYTINLLKVNRKLQENS